MKRIFSSQKAHGNKNRSVLTIGDLVNLKDVMYRRGHIRKVLHITVDANRIELTPLLGIAYRDKAFDRIKELRDSCTYINQVLNADNTFGIL